MTVVTDHDIRRMRLMAKRTFKIVRCRNMVLMGIKFVFLICANPFDDNTPRTMILACETGFRGRGCLGIGFAVMAGAARYAAIFMPVCRGLLSLNFLNLSFLVCGRPNNQQGSND